MDGVAAPEDAEFFDFTPSPNYADDGIVFGVGAGRHGCVQQCSVLFRSLDRGTTWERLPAMGFSGGTIMLAPSFPQDSRIFVNGPAGLQVSEDGGRQFDLLVPVKGPMFMSPGFSGGDRRIIVGASPGWEYDDDARATVPLTFTPPPTSVSTSFNIGFPSDYLASGIFFLGGSTPTIGAPQASAVFRCNRERCGEPVVLPRSVGAPELLTVTSRGSDVLFAWRSDALFASTDDGHSFTRRALPGTGRLTALTADGRGSLFSLVDDDGTAALYVSNDAGTGWQQVRPATGSSVPALRKVVPLPDGTLLGAPPAEAGGGLLCSGDGGMSWARRCRN